MHGATGEERKALALRSDLSWCIMHIHVGLTFHSASAIFFDSPCFSLLCFPEPGVNTLLNRRNRDLSRTHFAAGKRRDSPAGT